MLLLCGLDWSTSGAPCLYSVGPTPVGPGRLDGPLVSVCKSGSSTVGADRSNRPDGLTGHLNPRYYLHVTHAMPPRHQRSERKDTVTH